MATRGRRRLRRGRSSPTPAGRSRPGRDRPAGVGELRPRRSRRRPRVAILATGSELRLPGEPLGPGQIRNSNSFTAYGQVLAAGGEPVLLGIARDDLDETRRLLADALEQDVVITSGGVSVGEYDFVKQVQDELGVGRRFWGVATKPGKPLAFGTRGDTLVFGVPGNPVAAMVSFEMYVRPALLALQGRQDLYRPYVFAAAEEPVKRSRGRTEARRCRLLHRGRGWGFTTTGPQGSGILRSMALADGLVFVPPEYPGAAPGAIRRGPRAAPRTPLLWSRDGLLQRRRALEHSPDDQAVAGAVGWRAGREHQAVAPVAKHADVVGQDHRRLRDLVAEPGIRRVQEDAVAALQPVELVEGRAVGRAVAGDGERLAGSGQGREAVVHRAVAEQGVVGVGVEARGAAGALLHKAIEADEGDPQAPDRVARLQTAPVEHGQAAHDLRRGEVARARAGVGRRHRRESSAVVAVGRIQPGLLHLGVPGRPERVGEHEPAGDQQDVGQQAHPAAAAGRSRGSWPGLPLGRGLAVRALLVVVHGFHGGMVPAASEPDKHARLARLSEEATMRSCSDVHNLLNEQGVDHEIIHLPSLSKTAQRAASLLGVAPAEIVKSLVFYLDGAPTLVLAPGDATVDTVALARELGVRDVTFARGHDVLTV